MTEICETTIGDLYDIETQIGSVSVDIDATSLRTERDADLLRAVQRLERAAKAELQAMQDELDDDGEVKER